MDRSEAEFSEAHDKAKEYLDNQKDKLSSLATDTLTDIDSKKQNIVHQQEDLEELSHKFWSCLFDEEILQNLKESEFKGPDTKISADSLTESHSTPSLGKDMWNQIKHVSIPAFNDDKMLYEGW